MTREEQLREIAAEEEMYREIIRKMDYPDGGVAEGLWNAATRVFGFRSGMRRGAEMGIERCQRRRGALGG